MLIAVVNNGVVEEVADYTVIFPNTSFPSTGPDAEFLAANNCMIVTVWKPYNQITQKLVPATPYIEDNQVFTIVVEDKTPEELAQTYADQWNVVKMQRDKILYSCDWTQLPDCPLTTEEVAQWRTYRQEVRDVVNQQDPFNITWPVSPDPDFLLQPKKP